MAERQIRNTDQKGKGTWTAIAIFVSVFLLLSICFTGALGEEGGQAALVLQAVSARKVYDGLPLSDTRVEALGLPEGYTLEAEAAGVQVTAGESENVVLPGYRILDRDGRDVTASFPDAEIRSGLLQVEPLGVDLEITGTTVKVDYDGQPHRAEGYTVISSSPLYHPEKDLVFSGNALTEGTGACETVMGLKEQQFANQNPNFEILSLKLTDGGLFIYPIDTTVTILGSHVTAEYDRQQHVAEGYEVESASGLYSANDMTFTGRARAARAEAGTTQMGLAPEQFTNRNPNFRSVTFEVVDGYVTVEPKPVRVRVDGHRDTVNFDGKSHAVYGFDLTISSPMFTRGDLTVPASTEAIRTDAGTTAMGLSEEQFVSRNPNFDVTVEVYDGCIRILPAAVTVQIQGRRSALDYDGQEHAVEGYDMAASSALYSENYMSFTGTARAARTHAGKAEMGLKAGQFANLSENFDVTFEVSDGWQTIYPISTVVMVRGARALEAYDGNTHTVSGYEITCATPLLKAEDIACKARAEAGLRDAGEMYMGLTAEDFSVENPDFTDVVFRVSDGFVKVVPAQTVVEIRGKTDTVYYDGEEHSVSGYTFLSSNPLYTEKDMAFHGTAKAGQREAGTAAMGLAPDQFENLNPSFSSVTFRVLDGSQTVLPLPVQVQVTGERAQYPYDGESHSVSGFRIQADTALYSPEDVAFTGSDTAQRRDAGETLMGLSEEEFKNLNPNFGPVTFEVSDGSLKILPAQAQVLIRGKKQAAGYDGTEHRVSGYEVVISHPAYREEDIRFKGTASAARRDAGIQEMGLKAEQFENTNPNFDQVAFTVEDGFMAVAPEGEVLVLISGHRESALYDGMPHTASGFDVISSDPSYTEADFAFSGKGEAERTDAGESRMGLSESQFENLKAGTKAAFLVTDGGVEVSPLPVAISVRGNRQVQTYDGISHWISGYTLSLSTPLYDENDLLFTGTASASRTEAGETDMGLAPEQFSSSNSNFDPVAVSVLDGGMTVTPCRTVVHIEGRRGLAVYDGTEHRQEGYGFRSDSDLYGETFVRFAGTAEALQTEAGETWMGLDAALFENLSPDFEPLFQVTDGCQSVVPCPVTLLAEGHTSSVTYDGQEHRLSGYDLYSTSNAFGPEDLRYSGGASAVRNRAGVSELRMSAQDFRLTSSSFTLTALETVNGWQEVLPLRTNVTVYGKNAVYGYDGGNHGLSGYTMECGSSLYAQAYMDRPMQSGVSGVEAGVLALGLREADFRNQNDSFDPVVVHVLDGQLTICPARTTVVIRGSRTLAGYDGEMHRAEGYTVDISSSLYREGNIAFAGTALAETEDAGTVYMGLDESQFTNLNSSFICNFEVEDGFAAVYPARATVRITGARHTRMYSGQEQRAEGFEADISNPLYSDGDFRFTGKAQALRVGAGTTAMGLEAGQFANVNPNFEPVTFEVTDGRLTVLPAHVLLRVQGKRETCGYDGRIHTLEGFEVLDSQGLYNAENLAYSGTAKAEGLEPGIYALTLLKDGFRNTSPDFSVEILEVSGGELVIEPGQAHVRILGNSVEAVYDGKAHLAEGYRIESDCLYTRKDFIFSGEDTAERTDAGTSSMGMTADQFRNINPHYASVAFEVTDGSVSVTPAPLTVKISGEQAEGTYNGKEQEASGFTFEADNPLYIREDFRFSGEDRVSRRDAGTSEMGLTPENFENLNPNFSPVTFRVQDGSVSVSPAPVSVTVQGNLLESVYSGKEQEVSGFTFEADNPLYTRDDFRFDGEDRVMRRDAGTSEMGLTPEDFVNLNPNFSPVTFTVQDGGIRILKRPVAVYTPSVSRAYTGSLVKGEETYTVINLVEGHEGTISCVPAQGTEPGEYDNGGFLNDFRVMNGEENVTDNYVLQSLTPGKLKITEDK